ncbi:MAG TPA: plastocyanin/azurin family copper-binding protein [Myxococcaceae bacterium]|nr:plastocyanin/azurin family copper-binding protein [Myxococcaceae bacterium]
MKHVISGFALAVALVGLGCGSSNNVGLKPGINGCTSFTDATAPGASRVINFGGNFGNVYDQPCLAVSATQQVTFSGAFSSHPLRPGLAPSQAGGPDAGTIPNPIPSTSSGNTLQFAFVNTGTYPFYCSLHESIGMFGAIQVR